MIDRAAGSRCAARTNGFPTMLGDHGVHLPPEWFGHLLHFGLGQEGHAPEFDHITPEEIGEAGGEVVHQRTLWLASRSGASTRQKSAIAYYRSLLHFRNHCERANKLSHYRPSGTVPP